MQRARGAALLAGFVGAVALVASWCSACSGGAGEKAVPLIGPDHRVCDLLAQLDGTGTAVARADLGDPAAFDAALSTSVQRYASVLGQLQKVAPPAIVAPVA